MSRAIPTIDDVAKLAGVARVTVSRVLNGEPNVSAATKTRVQAAVKSLGYSPNPQARALASGASRQVLLVHSQSPEQEPNSYYHAGLELGALRGCSAMGFELTVRAIDSGTADAAGVLAAIIERERPAGITLSPPLSDDIALLRRAKALGARVVAISAGEEARRIVSSVGIDEKLGGRAMAEHLLSLGHRRIGFVGGPGNHRAATLRLDGFEDVLREAGVAGLAWVATGDFTFKSGVEAADRLLAEAAPVTALACANDDMAAGAMLAFHRAGVDIPGQISVTGFDDTPMSEIVWPPLTTVRQPIKLLGERAVRLLNGTESGAEAAPVYDLVPHSLVVRESAAELIAVPAP